MLMRHIAITIGTAAALVGGYLLLRSEPSGEGRARVLPAPAGVPQVEPPVSRSEPRSQDPATIAGLSEIEALHRRHGAVGDAMRSFLALSRGLHWTAVDRGRMQEAIHAVRSHATEADVAYLLDLFNRTPDASFRWWFSWLVQQIPDPRFIDAMTEVYRIDPHRGIDAMASINSPLATERYLKLLDAEPDPSVREHAVVALAHTDWPDRESAVSAIARDEARAGPERLEALTALGRTGLTADSTALLMEVALGPRKPIPALSGNLAVSHPVPDLRSGAVLAVMLRGDQESARRLIEAADAPGADPELGTIVDAHLASFRGPDLSELIYDRVRRRGFVSAGEVFHLVRDIESADRSRLRDLIPFVRDPEAKALLDRVVSAR